MIDVFKGLKLRIAAAIILAILFYGILTAIASTQTLTIAVKEARKAPTTLTLYTTATLTKAKPQAEAAVKAHEGLIDKEHISEYKTFIQNLLISIAIASATMAIFRMRMR